MLLKLFTEADKACKDPCRFFLGGKHLVYMEPNAAFRLDQLGYITQRYILEKQMDHFAREVSGLVKDLDIGINEKYMLDIYSNYMPNEHFRAGELSMDEVVAQKIEVMRTRRYVKLYHI